VVVTVPQKFTTTQLRIPDGITIRRAEKSPEAWQRYHCDVRWDTSGLSQQRRRILSLLLRRSQWTTSVSGAGGDVTVSCMLIDGGMLGTPHRDTMLVLSTPSSGFTVPLLDGWARQRQTAACHLWCGASHSMGQHPSMLNAMWHIGSSFHNVN